MKYRLLPALLVLATAIGGCSQTTVSNNNQETLKVLIIDGQNNHTIWPKSTIMMKTYLEQTNLFSVDIYRTKNLWRSNKYINEFPLNDGKTYTDLPQPKTDETFAPNFSQYDVVVSNFGWKAAPWPETTKASFEQYMKSGGGLVLVHAADNSFPKWDEFNKMIGLGGWGGRNESNGPYVYYDNDGNLIRDNKKGHGGAHGPKHEFKITTRAPQHPIMEGLPAKWLHTTDELYAYLRGPAENLTVLATAHDQKNKFRHEPMLMTIEYHKGRVFHSTLGHDQAAYESVGFITTFLRGTEWAATGKVTQGVPSVFPTETTTKVIKFD